MTDNIHFSILYFSDNIDAVKSDNITPTTATTVIANLNIER